MAVRPDVLVRSVVPPPMEGLRLLRTLFLFEERSFQVAGSLEVATDGWSKLGPVLGGRRVPFLSFRIHLERVSSGPSRMSDTEVARSPGFFWWSTCDSL